MPRKARYAKQKTAEAVADVVAKASTSRRINMSRNPSKLLLKDLARLHTEVALNELVRIMKRSKSEALRLQAIEILLNRGWGKPVQPVAGPDGEGPQQHVVEVRRTFVRPTGNDADD